MPPVNTPATQRTPTSPQTPTRQPGRPLTPLSYLSSPVPDLASTLHTSGAADQADEANVSFLRDSLESLDQAVQPSRRSHVDAQRDPRQREYQSETRPAQPHPQPQSQQDTAEDLSRRERLQRVLARLNRLHEPSAPSTSAYSNRTPSPNRQSLYDWAPGHDDSQQEDRELDAILSELRRQQPETHPDILRILSQSQLEGSRQPERGTGASAGASASARAAPADSSDMTDALERLDRFERRTRERRERERRARESEWLSLRSRAILQRARQDGGGSPSATERMLRYVVERERSGMSEEEERARGTGWFRPSPVRGENDEQQNGSAQASRGHWALPLPTELRERDRQERVEAFRRGYLAENAPPRTARISTPPVPSTSTTPSDPSAVMLENALKYLNELRSCVRYEDSLSAAMDHGLATKEFLAVKHDDFIMDLDELPPLPYSSWLQPGTVFEGHQHATAGGVALTQQRPQSTTHTEQINPNYRPSTAATTTGFDHPPGSTRVTPFDPSRPWQFTTPIPVGSAKDSHDHWPVRVIIHSVNPEKMTLQGTMEAYDVPQHHAGINGVNSAGERPKAGKKGAPITTYLEGHIIDLRTHTFLTPNPQDGKRHPSRAPNASIPESVALNDTVHFPSANAQTDAQNWLKLPPFSNLTTPGKNTGSAACAELARLLLSKSRLQSLNEEYIFMRWKERCFVHSSVNDPCTAPETDRRGDQDRGHGLTISGFYYVSLRRSDGVVAGLYFDPTSTPFQHLRLKGTGGGWGAWGFR